MFRKTITGSLLAVSLTAGALMTVSPASAAPTWVESASISHNGLLPQDAAFAMSENGNAVATWIRKVDGVDRVQASYFTAGPNAGWSYPDTITYDFNVVASPDAAVNDKGEAVVTWIEKDVQGDLRVAGSRYIGKGTFDARFFVSTDNNLDTTGELSTGIDGAGKVWVAHHDTDGGNVNRIRVSTKTRTGLPVSLTMTDDTSFTPSLAVNETGQTVLAWFDAGNGESVINVRRYRPEVSAWTQPDATSIPDSYSVTDVRTALNDAGNGVVAVVQDVNGDMRVALSKSYPDGFLTDGAFVPGDGSDASGLDVAINEAGTTLLSWSEHTDVHRARWITRSFTGSFGTPNTVAGNLAAATRTNAAISDSGMLMVGFADNGSQRAIYKTTPLAPIQTFNSGPLAFQAGETGVGVDNQGNGFLGGVIKANGTDGSVHGSFLDTAGPTSSIYGVKPNTLATSFAVNWVGHDRLSPINGGRVRVRAAAWNGGFGGFQYPYAYAIGESLPFAGAPGRTYCFSAQSRDLSNNYGVPGAETCTTTPVDDRALKMAGGFSRKNGGAHYRGTYTQATKNGATLTLTNVKASRIAILVTKVAKGGKIQVKFGKKILGTYSLKGSGLKQLVAQKSLGGLKTGTLTIKVVSASGKVVKIDGVVAAK